MRTTDDKIKEINHHISQALEIGQDAMLNADVYEWAYRLNYTPADLLNALYIFNHVAQNIGIKNGTLNLSNVEAVGAKLREMVREMTGYDPHKLVENDKTLN